MHRQTNPRPNFRTAMRPVLRRALCLLLALAMTLAAPATAASDGSDIIFLALNDAMPYTLAADTMPYWSGGALYVHSTVFDITSLNLSASYNAGNMTLLLYSGSTRRSLTFYLSEGYVQTQSGATEEITAALRGGQVFVPLDYCANFFGIGVSYLTSRQGWPVVRLTTGAQVWEDAFFVEKAENLITERAGKYMGSTDTPVAPDNPGNTTNTTTPVTPGEPDTPPDESDEPDEPAGSRTVYLALVGAEAAEAALPLLAERELRATVYLTAEELQAGDGLARRVLGAGHGLGIVGDLEAGRAALAQLLCPRSFLTLDQTAAGWFCHRSTHDADSWTEIGAEPALLRLEGPAAGEALCALLEDGDCTILPLRETTALFTETVETTGLTTEPPIHDAA